MLFLPICNAPNIFRGVANWFEKNVDSTCSSCGNTLRESSDE